MILIHTRRGNSPPSHPIFSRTGFFKFSTNNYQPYLHYLFTWLFDAAQVPLPHRATIQIVRHSGFMSECIDEINKLPAFPATRPVTLSQDNEKQGRINMSLKRGLITVWLLAVITILKTCLVVTLCRLNIDTKRLLMCNHTGIHSPRSCTYETDTDRITRA